MKINPFNIFLLELLIYKLLIYVLFFLSPPIYFKIIKIILILSLNKTLVLYIKLINYFLFKLKKINNLKLSCVCLKELFDLKIK